MQGQQFGAQVTLNNTGDILNIQAADYQLLRASMRTYEVEHELATYAPNGANAAKSPAMQTAVAIAQRQGICLAKKEYALNIIKRWAFIEELRCAYCSGKY